MQGVRGDDGGRMPGESPDDSTWEGGGDATVLENPGRGGRATDFMNGIPGEGRPVEIPSREMPGPSGDKDGNAGAIPAPACPRHRGNYEGGKPPPPTVRLMRHASHLAGAERQAPCRNPVCQRPVAEETAACRGGDKGELGEGI